MASRKAIAAALLALLAPNGGPFASSSRRLAKPEQAAAPGAPALYLIKPKETYHYVDDTQQGVPPVRFMDFMAVIYTDVGDNQNTAPADVIDDLIDTIDAALAPSGLDQLQNGGRVTLGGLVYSARIEGDPFFAPGDVEGKGITTVPIRVWFNSYP